MTTAITHVGTSVNYGPIVAYSHFNAQNPALNVIDTTTPLFPTLQSGETRVAVGMLPTGDSSVSRTVFVDGLAPFSAGSATVSIRFGSPTGPVIATFQATVATNTEPPGADVTGATVSAEYTTPTSR